MENPIEPAPKKRRGWRSLSLRGMLLLVLVIGLPMGWWARKAQLQRAAVARIEAIGGAVLYDFEIIDPDGGATAEATDRVNQAGYYSLPSPASPPSRPWGDWARKTLGVDYVNSVTQVIAVDAEGLQDDDFALLANLPKLESLNLGESPIGDRGMVHVGKLHGLKNLNLNARKLTDEGFAHLEGLDQLEGLAFSAYSQTIDDKTINDAALARLKGMKKLQNLDIIGMKITDEGLRSLEELSSLEVLYIDAPNVTATGLARLGKSLPKLQVFPSARTGTGLPGSNP